MRWIIYALLGILLSACPFSLACEHPQPKTDVSRYTADQVIYIVKAKSPSCIRIGLEASYSAQYLGNKTWKVTKTCEARGYTFSIDYWYFYEDTGWVEQRKY